MKCKNCGASVSSRSPACEFCGTANEVYIRRKQEIEFLLNVFNRAKRRALLEAAPDIVVRVLNRFVAIAVLAAVVAIIVNYAIFSIQSRPPAGSMEEHMPVLEQMHKEKRYDEIRGYLFQNKLFGEEYAVYHQTWEVYYKIETFRANADYFESDLELAKSGINPDFAKEDAKKHFYDILRTAHDIKHFFNEDVAYLKKGELFPENADLYQECLMEVSAYLKYKCGLSNEELTRFFELKNNYSDEFYAYSDELYNKYF